MTDKLGNNVGSTFDDDLYAFVKAAAALSNTDVSGYIRAAMIDLRDKQRNETKVWQNVFERQIQIIYKINRINEGITNALLQPQHCRF